MPPIKAILLFNFISLASMMAILPVIGPIVKQLGLTAGDAGLIVGISGVFWMLCSRYWGKKSDEYGRRNILLIANSGYTLSYLALSIFLDMALDAHWSIAILLTFFIVLRSAMGAFYAAIPTVGAARIADVTTEENRTSGMAMLGATNGFGMIVGPLLAGLLAKQSLTLPLYTATAISVIAILVIFIALPKQQQRIPTKQLPIKLNDPRLRLPVIAAFFANFCILTANVCIGFYGIDILHLSPQNAAQQSGYAMGIVGIAMIIAQIMMTKCKSVSTRRWLISGVQIACIGFLTITLLTTVAGMLVSYFIAAFGLGLTLPALQSMASQQVGADEQGIALGSVSAAQGLAMVIAPIASTQLYDLNPFIPYVLAAVLLLLLSIYATVQKIQTPA